VGALALYAALAVGFIDHGVSVTRYIAGQGSDPYAFIWFMAWWPWALAHHVDPFFTKLIWQPLGVSLCWITSVPALALFGLPVTLLAGPVVTYNILIILAPLLSAWFAYLVCVKLTRDLPAALVGGFLFGFSSYEMAQDTSALNLCFSFYVPALLLVVLARLDEAISRKGSVFWASLILILQFLSCIEIFALIFVFGGMAWMAAWLYLPARRMVLQRLFVDGLYTAPFVAIPLVPFFVSMFRHYHLIHNPDIWPYFFTADLVNVFIPSEMNLYGTLFTAVSKHFNNGINVGPQEQDAYIGIPLLVILFLFGRDEGGTPRGRLLIVLFLIFLVLSLGPRLWIGGHYTSIILPWAIFANLPLISGALPARFALFVSLVAAIIAALWIAAPGSRRSRVLLGILACVALLPQPHPWKNIPNSAFFEPRRVQQALGENPRILILPFAINGPSSFWQQENHFGFSQTGGYLGFPPAPMQHFAAVGELFGNSMGPHFLADFITFCTATKTQYIVIGAGAKPEMVSALMTLDWPAKKIDDVTVLTVPNS
jgi:hypothetical protein